MVQVKGLVKTFTQGSAKIPAVDHINFDLLEGETLAIVGPSGSGKTTLLSLLAGLDRAEQGSIEIAGQDITKMTEAELSRFRGQNIGIIFQQFHLMPHLSALENVRLPLDILGDSRSLEKAQQTLKEVGLESRSTHLPGQLSGGECQRVAIARAAVVEPKILFADEPSGNLDSETGKRVTDLLFQLVKDKKMTMIMVTHDLTLAQRCGSIHQIQGGRLL
jgi:putative ABC transport system ATP-binding protein